MLLRQFSLGAPSGTLARHQLSSLRSRLSPTENVLVGLALETTMTFLSPTSIKEFRSRIVEKLGYADLSWRECAPDFCLESIYPSSDETFDVIYQQFNRCAISTSHSRLICSRWHPYDLRSWNLVFRRQYRRSLHASSDGLQKFRVRLSFGTPCQPS
jgi:hypothetical protein